MQEPGLDRHEWETEWEAIEPLLEESPTEALGEADRLVARMLEARGFPLAERDGEALEEPETVRQFQEARRITRQLDSGDAFDPGDVAHAVDAYRGLYAYLLDLGPAASGPV